MGNRCPGAKTCSATRAIWGLSYGLKRPDLPLPLGYLKHQSPPGASCQAWSFYAGFKVTAGASLGASCITPELGPPSHSLSPPPSLLHRGGAGEISSYTSSRKSFFSPFTKKASESLGGRGTLIIDNCGGPSWRSVGVCAFPTSSCTCPEDLGQAWGGGGEEPSGVAGGSLCQIARTGAGWT